jgi:hypothetical protein
VVVNNSSNLQKARDIIKKLFKHLDIKRVVCVDDQYDNTPTLERFKNLYDAYLSLPDGERQPINKLSNISMNDLDLLDSYQEKFWSNLSDKDKKEILALLQSQSTTKDTEYADILKKLLQPYNLKELSLAKWKREEPRLLADSKEAKTLFLFDQDFSKEGGSSTEGIELITHVLSSAGTGTVLCGLLSHTYKPEDEQNELEKYTDNHSENKDRFVFISKQRLNNDPVEFARSIKLTVLSPKFKHLKEETAKIIEEADSLALQRIEQVRVYDFEQIVFQSSFTEGVWEPDTLFRLFGFYHRAFAREKARGRDVLHELAADIRPISIISTDSDLAPQHRSWEIQRFELYEDEKYINNLHMPIELGDIFEVLLKAGIKKFILLAQPCDLMIRKSGNRKQAVTEVMLAEIVNSEDLEKNQKDEKGKPLDKDSYGELLYFNKDGRKAFVSFQQKHSVKLSIVDLCVYQKDGSAILTINDVCPKYVIPTWQKHYDKAEEKARKAIEDYQKLQELCKNLAEDERKYIFSLASPRLLELPMASTTDQSQDIFSGDINPSEGYIRYNLRRCGRLSQARSIALLARFASFLTRDAFEHDFGGGNE